MTTYDVMIMTVETKNRKTGKLTETKFKITDTGQIKDIIANMRSKRVEIISYGCYWIREINI